MSKTKDRVTELVKRRADKDAEKLRELTRQIQDAEARLRLAEAKTLLIVGKLAVEAENYVPKGKVNKWAKEQLGIGWRVTFYRIAIYRAFGKVDPETLSRFELTALNVLSTRNIKTKVLPERAIDEAIKLAKAGKTITKAVALRLLKKYK